jgi:hypothetical protein
MKLRTLGLITVVVGVAGGAVWWRRRRRAADVPPVQLGLGDGSTHTLGRDDPEITSIQREAALLREALESEA